MEKSTTRCINVFLISVLLIRHVSIKNFSEKNFGARIDFIYISPDLKSAFTGGNFIIDDFTKKYSDHRPVYMTWEK